MTRTGWRCPRTRMSWTIAAALATATAMQAQDDVVSQAGSPAPIAFMSFIPLFWR